MYDPLTYVAPGAVMANPKPTRLENLLASLVLGLHDDITVALEATAGLTGSGPVALLALDEFMGGATVGKLAEVLGLTHSGAVRLVALLEAEGFVERRKGEDLRSVEVRLTRSGRRHASRVRAARDGVVHRTLADVDADDATELERLVGDLVETAVRARMRGRETGRTNAWWCRTCDFGACGRPEGRCPAQSAAVDPRPPESASSRFGRRLGD